MPVKIEPRQIKETLRPKTRIEVDDFILSVIVQLLDQDQRIPQVVHRGANQIIRDQQSKFVNILLSETIKDVLINIHKDFDDTNPIKANYEHTIENLNVLYQYYKNKLYL